jgi:5'(3')-deoxyribonucleotidase
MKISELLLEDAEDTGSEPIVYVDMDGVLADLYNYAAELYDVEHYNHMTPEQWESFFKDSDAYHLFRDIEPFPTANQLLQIVKKFAGGYTILSSPLSFDKAGSIRGKREWLSKNITVSPDEVIFEHDKYKYAVQPDGTPNILIDDYGVNIRKWRDAGGIAIKYQADEDSLDKVVSGLKHAERIIKDK